ncbi:MAG: HAMP domain-containing histidine kinase [Chloroflexi bacterium]|nr:HAMP domain-containing histidine kinase [Chloroflexota bacterium]
MHDIGISLTNIMMSADILREELASDQQSIYGKLVQSIIRNAESIEKTLPSLQESETSEASQEQFHPQPLKLNTIVADITSQMLPQIQKRGQILTVKLADNLPDVQSDKPHLEQILTNLLTNACKYTPEQGHIGISCSQNGDGVIVQITDDGIGISDTELTDIFHPYYQTERSRNHTKRGSGLGLAITKLFVELNGGQIWVKSTEGKGSSFYFSLPGVVSK